MMSKKGIVNAIVRGDKKEALKLKNGLSNSMMVKTRTVIYRDGLPDEPTKEQKKAFDDFINTEQSKTPDIRLFVIIRHIRTRHEENGENEQNGLQ